MISIGPFALPTSAIVVALALIVAVGAGALSARRQAPGSVRRLSSLVMDTALVGFVAARLGFIVAWWPSYLEYPLSVFYISDGGFLVWVGALVAIVFAAWRIRNIPALRPAMGVALLTGWMVWAIAGGILSLTQRTQVGLPDAALATLDGGTVQLAQVSDEPMVVNLWATWCPPCRREMPMLEAAQERHPGITFVFANQRQGPAAIRDYLQDENLQLNHVLIDAHGAIAQSVGSRALPTTLFYDAEGNLVDTHRGMMTSASLAATLQQNGLTSTAGNNLNHTGDDE